MDLRSPPQTTPKSGGQMKTTLILGLQFIVIALLVLVAFTRPDPQASDGSSDDLRKVASKLRAAGAIDEAALLYSEVLASDTNHTNRTQIAYSLAEMYIESAEFEKALRWLYEAELTPATELKTEIANKIVLCLERLGRVHAARAALKGSTQIQDAASAKRSEKDIIVAKIGNDSIYYSQVQRALDDLPAEISAQFNKPGGHAAFLKKFVADELLWRKAQKLEYDRDPETQRQISSMIKHLVVGQFVEKELAQNIKLDPADVKNFYEANQERFQNNGKQLPFEQVKDQATQAYRMMKIQSGYAQMVESELQAGDVAVFADKLPKQ